MACKNICKLCDKLVISTNVTFEAGNLWIWVPAGEYRDGEKYCIVVAQNIPTTTPIDAPVRIYIEGGTQLYPLTTNDCRQVTARAIRTRTKYSTCVRTDATSGVFRLLGKLCNCVLSNGVPYIDGDLPT